MTENSPDVSAQDKLKIIRRLNRVISDHRKNVGVNSVFGDVDDTNQGSEPTSKGSQSNTGRYVHVCLYPCIMAFSQHTYVQYVYTYMYAFTHPNQSIL